MNRLRLLHTVSVLVLFCYLWYWATTILYLTPNNYVRIQFDDYLETFNSYFFQRWDFFAPPPKTNTRIYYSFISKEDSTVVYTYEVLKPITIEKQNKAPFNMEEEILDYILSTSAVLLSQTLSEQIDIFKIIYPDSSEIYHQESALEIMNLSRFGIPGYATLINYSNIIADKQKIDSSNFYVEISVTEKDILPFSQRRNDPLNANLIENLSFRSDWIELNIDD